MNQKAEIVIANQPLEFLQEKIQQLQTALFFSLSNAVLKFPTHVVNSAVLDETGLIWFVIPKPTQHIGEFDKEFPAKLDFFKKGMDFYLKIEGNASIVTNQEEIDELISSDISAVSNLKINESIILKLKINQVDYTQAVAKTSQSRKKTARTPIYNWFNSRQERRQPQLAPIPIQPTYGYRDLK